MSGYLHPAYARSLAEFGTPLHLRHSGGTILRRSIPDTAYEDAIGPYPLFACQEWQELGRDLAELEGQLVSVGIVPDPFGSYSVEMLQQAFVDVVRPFKSHFVVDLSQVPEAFVSNHHQRNTLKAERAVTVETCERPITLLEEWNTLYSKLIERHQIRGITAFSPRAFAIQLQVPGIVAFRAVHQGQTISILLWYRQGEVVYYHLGAHNSKGYELSASFALFWHALEVFRADSDLVWLNLGGGAGISPDADDGLSRFKRGWATGARTAYFCGRILDRALYRTLVQERKVGNATVFPAYRQGEFS